MAEAHSAEQAARYILTIFSRHNSRAKETVLMHNLTLPFEQDGWSKPDLDAGLAYALEQTWIEMGKDNKFVRLTEAGFSQPELDSVFRLKA